MNDKLDKNRLMNDLRDLLLKGKVNKQEELCAVLTGMGHQVNQPRISRLIRKLNAIKSKNEAGEIVYRLAREPAPPTVTSQLSNLVVEVTCNETLIIVNTSPGSAQLIARILDHNKTNIQILGTIAGDDSIFIAPLSVKKIKDAVQSIKKLLLL